MITKTLIRPLGHAVAILLAVTSVTGCRPAGPTRVQLEALGTEVLLADGLGLVVPNAYHAVQSTAGLSFVAKGSSKPAYDTIVIERREEGHPALLDDALDVLLARLEPLEHFNLLDVQLTHVGPHLALSYAADFAHLEVPRRQWGMLIGTDTGILAIVMTSPKDTFQEATDGYLSVLGSLHENRPPKAPAQITPAPTPQGSAL